MENETPPVGGTMTIEEAVKLETIIDMDTESFEVGQITLELATKDYNYEITEEITNEIILNRIWNEHSYAKAWIKHYVSNEACLKVTEIPEELTLKNEDDFDGSKDENIEALLKRISSECAKVEDDVNFISTTVSRERKKLVDKIVRSDPEMLMNMNSQDTDTTQFHHVYSSANVRSGIHSKSMVKHNVPRTQHPVAYEKPCRKSFSCYDCNYTTGLKYDLINHMTKHNNKILKCPNCTYKTTIKHCLARHMLTHPGTASKYKPNKCIHCNASFSTKQHLGHHIISKHEKFIASVTCTILKCPNCTYKTTIKHCLARHMLTHSGTARKYKLNKSIHCNASFSGRQKLDHHIISKLEDSIASVSSTILRCPNCTYKTTIKHCLARHMLTHSGTASKYKLNKCIYCNASFSTEPLLDDHISKHKPNKCIHCNASFSGKQKLSHHIINKHGDSIASVSSTILRCPNCTYKTTIKHCLDRHLLMHSERAGSYEIKRCIHCNGTFKNKQNLDNHIIRIHPEFITSVSSKIHECTQCSYKTTKKCLFNRHILIHPEEAYSFEFYTCI